MMDPRIDDMIDTCRGTPHKIATNLKKEFITDVTCSSVRVLQTPRNVSRTCRDRNTPGNTPYSVRSPQANSPFLIGVIGVSPTIGHSGILQVLNKRQSTVSDEIEDTQKLDTSIDIKLTNDGDSASIFIKVIGRELYHGSSADLYLRCWMDFASNIVGTEAKKFVELCLPDVNTSDEVGIFVTPATRIRRPTDGYHWSAPDHFFGESIEFRKSAIMSEQDYSYKTDFQIWRENQEFGRQNISMSRPPLDSTHIVTISQFDSITIGTKTPEPTPQTRPTELSTRTIELST